MNNRLRHEVDRLLSVFATDGKQLSHVPMHNLAVFEVAHGRIGIVRRGDERAYYLTFGGEDYQDLFAVKVAGPMMLAFRSLPGATEAWDPNGPHPVPAYPQLDLPPRDPRIQPDVVLHPGWLPLADFDGGSTTLYFDDAPAAPGRRGQIIVYQHDPDEVFFVAEDFVGLLKSSNDLLERQWDKLFPEY